MCILFWDCVIYVFNINIILHWVNQRGLRSSISVFIRKWGRILSSLTITISDCIFSLVVATLHSPSCICSSVSIISWKRRFLICIKPLKAAELHVWSLRLLIIDCRVQRIDSLRFQSEHLKQSRYFWIIPGSFITEMASPKFTTCAVSAQKGWQITEELIDDQWSHKRTGKVIIMIINIKGPNQKHQVHYLHRSYTCNLRNRNSYSKFYTEEVTLDQ